MRSIEPPALIACAQVKPRHRQEPKGRPARVPGTARSAGAARTLAPPAETPAPPLWRDRWAWGCALAVIPVVLHALGARLGEPVAEDFDFLHRALFSPFTLLDGGGSDAFWRPIPHQVYYRLLWPVILARPGLLATLHVVFLALATVLLYRAFRRGWPPAWAAVIATFPLLSESTRALISWPSHFVDLGVWLFTALALHEATARRLWSTLAALLAALLCKEVALLAVALVPWVPGPGPRDRRERLRWTAAAAALALVWAAIYWMIRERAGLHLPHQLETSATTVGTPIAARIGWAVANSLRALFSLPAASSPWAGPVGAAAVTLCAVALLVLLARRPRAGADTRAWVLWSLAWFLGACATMAPVFPIWAPNRSLYGSLGIGMLAAIFLGTAHVALLGALVALRLVAFALSPAAPHMVAPAAPKTGAFLDFERLARLQLLMHDTRRTLQMAYPSLPSGAGVGLYNLPHDAEYSFGGSRSLQAWYRDSTLHWVRHADLMANPNAPMVVVVEFEARGRPQVVLVPAEALHLLLRALGKIDHREMEGALADLARADSLVTDPAAAMFDAQVAGGRAVARAALGSVEEAERDARRGIALWPANVYAHFGLGIVEYLRGHLNAAAAQAETVLYIMPNHQGAKNMLEAIQLEARAHGPGDARR